MLTGHSLWPLCHVYQQSLEVCAQAGTVHLSEVDSAAEGHRPAITAAAVSSLAFDADGHFVASVSRGGTLAVHSYDGIRQGCALLVIPISVTTSP